jgi:NitT/TauT family transport system substrate-binding protein
MHSVDMETAQAGAAFITKNIDAAVLWEPWLTKAREQGKGYVLASTREYPDLIVDTLAFNRDVIQNPKRMFRL